MLALNVISDLYIVMASVALATKVVYVKIH